MQFDRVIRAKIFLTRVTEDGNPNPTGGYRGEIDITNLRIAFTVNKSQAWSTNTAQVRIYNLGADNRNRLKDFGDNLRLYAGYRGEDGAQLLFTGNITQFNHTFAQPDIITVLECGDGDNILNNSTISVSFTSKTQVREVIETIASKMGLNIVDFADTQNRSYENGFNDCGLGKDILDVACKKANLRWSVQNENLIIIPDNGSTSRPPVEINENTGMIGIPERYVDKKQFLYKALPPNNAPKPGWKVRVLLRPDLLPGDRIRLSSSRANVSGVFTILTIRHEGDNYGPIFESILEVFPNDNAQ